MSEWNICECGNKVSVRDILPEDFECCEWCTPEMRFDGIMWRRNVGGYLEQMETHGFDKLYTVELTGGKSVTVWANSQEIAEYIALEADGILEEL